MSDDNLREVYRTLYEGQNKYRYFLLATAGAGVAIAVNQTQDTVLSYSQTPLGAAVLCYALSFLCGCRQAECANAATYDNSEMLRVQFGRHPFTGADSVRIEVVSGFIRESIEEHSQK